MSEKESEDKPFLRGTRSSRFAGRMRSIDSVQKSKGAKKQLMEEGMLSHKKKLLKE